MVTSSENHCRPNIGTNQWRPKGPGADPGSERVSTNVKEDVLVIGPSTHTLVNFYRHRMLPLLHLALGNTLGVFSKRVRKSVMYKA